MPYTIAAALALQPQVFGFIAATATLGVGYVCNAVAPAVPAHEACTVDQPRYQAAMVAACVPIQSLGPAALLFYPYTGFVTLLSHLTFLG